MSSTLTRPTHRSGGSSGRSSNGSGPPGRVVTSSPGCSPRFQTPRRPERRTLGGQVAVVARQLGQPLMPWQQLVADVGLEVDDAGVPFYREVIVTVPRQSGKTTLVLAWELQRALGWGTPQRVVYTAQQGKDAGLKLLADQVPLIERSKLAGVVEQVYRAAGKEALILANGSRVEVMATTEDAGHGRTVDLGVIDEAFADVDARREQALLPAMSTRRAGQILIVSTAGTDASLYLRSKVELGRTSVDDESSRIAYFEWSAPADADPADPAVWWSCMPALGRTIDEPVVAHARASMSDGEFRRAFLNQWTSVEDRVIPKLVWEAACSPAVAPTTGVVFGFEVTPDRSGGSIVACSSDGIVELVEHRTDGVGWLPQRIRELLSGWGGRAVCVSGGPAAALECGGMLSPTDYVRACGSFFDGLAERRIRVRRDGRMDEAAASVMRKPVGDAWRWTSRVGVDVTPIVAATVGCWAARRAARAGVVNLAAFLEDDDDDVR